MTLVTYEFLVALKALEKLSPSTEAPDPFLTPVPSVCRGLKRYCCVTKDHKQWIARVPVLYKAELEGSQDSSSLREVGLQSPQSPTWHSIYQGQKTNK